MTNKTDNCCGDHTNCNWICLHCGKIESKSEKEKNKKENNNIESTLQIPKHLLSQLQQLCDSKMWTDSLPTIVESQREAEKVSTKVGLENVIVTTSPIQCEKEKQDKNKKKREYFIIIHVIRYIIQLTKSIG